MADRVGQQFGNYRLVALLGQGGFAEVYLGQHVRLELQAAIKVLHAQLMAEESAQFQQEAQTIARLTHPSIVRVFDFDVQDGVPFLVMDYTPNGSLRHHHPKGRVLPLPQVVSYVKQVATALQYAHERKFIHRDVKPENILLGREGEVLLSDFGLAALAHSSGSLSTQEAVGTLAYMAPEQIEGYPRAASDQYALAVVVYEWLCGVRPFEGSLTEVMVQHLSAPPPPLHEHVLTISPEVEQVVLRALAKDPKARFASVRDFAQALEQANQQAPLSSVRLADESSLPGPAVAVALAPNQAGVPTETTPSADFPAGAFDPTVLPGSSSPDEINTSQSREAAPAPTAAVRPSPLEPTIPVRRRIGRLSGQRSVLLVGLAVLVIVAGVLGSTSILTRFGVLSTGRSISMHTPVRGGTWTDDYFIDADSFLPQGPTGDLQLMVDQALYLPLFYGDAQGVIHPGAATAVPTLQNGGISADGKTWVFHLRPHLVWSDGHPYDARDVDFTWRLWHNPKFGGAWASAGPPYTLGLNMIGGAEVSADSLSITFHLKQAFAPFLALWVDGGLAPLPAHHFSRVAPDRILKSPDNLNPQVVSGPFLMAESMSGDHYTLVRNPKYYRAREGLPYLDKVVFRVVKRDTILKDLQAGTIDSSYFLDLSKLQAFRDLTRYTIVTSPTSANFEALFFNFHNTVLASHPEVRQAMAMAVDHQALIKVARQGLADLLCTDHPSALHPGYSPAFPCLEFDPATANKLLDDNGWVRGHDGVRTKGGQRLEFEYSTTASFRPERTDVEAIVQRNLRAIGIKLDIQNYPFDTFFGPFLTGGKASPPTGAVADRYDIAEFQEGFGYDPDDSSLLSCDQIPPNGANFDFYCNHALDALYKQELATVDPGARNDVFQHIHQLYLAELPFIVLYSVTDPSIMRKGTHNYQVGPFGNIINMAEWWCDNGKC
ncbi:MAG TPA: ABC transporter substrate-binding protein [Ktedonobacteraceae bacterium]|nr:ABC transporter substrate-binding protein [Ktedonobacteraceae bacterium]